MDVITVLPWLEQSWQQLADYINQARIPQALLVSGKPGTGKRQLIDLYAQALLCELPREDCLPCGHCHSCTLINAQTHPDLIIVEPEEPGKLIGIDIIRQTINRLALKPQFDSNRVVIIHSADALNNAAANAFLKCLEEPADRTSIILVAEKTSKLPATIRSRCQKLLIAQPDCATAVNWLKQQRVTACRSQLALSTYIPAGKDCEALLQLAQGSPLLAKEYADKNYLAVRNDYFNDWLKVANGTVNVLLLAEQWQKQEQAILSDVFIWITEWVMTLIKLGSNLSDCQTEAKTALQELTERLDLQELYQFYDLLLLSQKQLDSQLNRQLMIEQLLIEWSRLNKKR